MQRALGVETRELVVPGTIDLQILPYTSVTGGDLPIPKEIPTSDLLVPGQNAGYQGALREFQAKTPIQLRGAESCSNCTLAVKAFGFDYSDCITSTTTINLDTLLTNETNFMLDAFHIEITNGALGGKYSQDEAILVNVTRKITPDCNGTKLENQVCWLKPSIISYDLMVKGVNATFVSDSWKGDSIVKQSRYVARRPSHPVTHPANVINGKLSDMGSLFKIRFLAPTTSQLWNAQVTMSMTSIREPAESPKDYFVMAEPTRTGLASYIYYKQDPHGYEICTSTFDDPMDEILQSFRELVLRLAIVDAVGWNDFVRLNNSANNTTTLPFVQQTVGYESDQVRVLYVAHTFALVLATVISLLGPLATIFLFWGWWRLGRAFSMNPLELVNALLVREPGAESERGMGDPVSGATSMDGQRRGYQSPREFQPKQKRQETELTLANLPLLLSGSSNASKAQVVSHIKRIIRGINGREVTRDEDEKDKRKFDVSAVELESGNISSGCSSRSTSQSGKGRSRLEEPIIQYGVLDSTGRLGFAVADAEGVIRARCPRKGEML